MKAGVKRLPMWFVTLLILMWLDITYGRWQRIFYCNFESDSICGFSQDRTDVLDWTRKAGRTHTEGTGPADDRTTNGDYYMYFEASGVSRDQEARLMSPWFQSESQGIFLISFYYHMHGNGTGQLNVYVDSPGRRERFLWSAHGDQGESWIRADLVLYIDQDFRIVLEAIRGVSATSDIAIDDVHVFKSDSPLQCNFESFCSLFSQDYHGSILNWTSKAATTPTYMTGPLYDHTYRNETGHYMYLEATSRDPDHTARLVSKHLSFYENDRMDRLFSFHYHMYGTGIGALNVYLATEGVDERLVWSRAGDQGDQWHRAEIVILSNQTYQIIIEGVIGGYRHGDIAIDDIAITEYDTTDMPSSSTNSTTYSDTASTWTKKPSTTEINAVPKEEQRPKSEKSLTEAQLSLKQSQILIIACVVAAIVIAVGILSVVCTLYRQKRRRYDVSEDRQIIVEADFENKKNSDVSVNVSDKTAFYSHGAGDSSALASNQTAGEGNTSSQ